MESRTRTSSEQFSMLLEFMERHGDLTKCHPNIRRRIVIDQMWQELSDSLNAVGTEAPKTAEKWKKVWADWKTKTKKKLITIRRGRSRTKLTASEVRLLGIMGAKSISHAYLEEQGSDRQSTVPSESSSTDNANEHGSPQAALRVMATPEPIVAPSMLPTDNQFRAQTDSSTNQHSESPPTTSRRHNLRMRRRMQFQNDSLTREFVSLERRRLRLEEIREENESRRIDAYVERNNVLCRLADIAQSWLDNYIRRENAQN